MRMARAARTVLLVGLAGCLLGGCAETVAGRGALQEGPFPGRPSAGPGTAGPGTPAPPSPPTPAPTPTPTRTVTATPAPPRTPPPGTVPAEFAGTWTGPVTQPRSAIPRWTARLVLARGRRSGTFVVSGFCRGSMTLLAVSRTRLVAREVISSDPQNRCAASGTVTLRRTAADRATMRWVDSDHPDNVASGTLTRD